ncbi:hypothetical protein CA850_32720 [Micromonospora echinospora]|uniref:Uncharacterized protein n=1 Tax=Micromonospora echinospora TaxID=1877 RepID=A0A1C4X4S5_MICEC|nr:hypothetical protein [Micromonospora echinospora]OZV72121.1 hypothetical protein CA850_32720 [Micromonospora echinospora]SCF03465.1 hypothetical protein GA0070618_2753 [Micromonospora echinospora]
MTERIRALLDSAVADTHPTSADPVPEVLRRGAAARRRQVTTGLAGVVTVALLVGGGLVATGWPTGDASGIGPAASPTGRRTPDPLPDGSGRKGTPRPFLVELGDDEAIRVNGLVVPAPPGWRVNRDVSRPLTYCEVPARSILVDVNVGPGGDCDAQPMVVVRRWHPPYDPPNLPPQTFSSGLTEVVLPGGQPAWFADNDVDGFAAFGRGRWAAFNVEMPWSGAGLTVEMTPAELNPFAASIHSATEKPGRLVLPEAAPAAQLGQRGHDRIDSSDATAVAMVLDRLRDLDRTVDEDELTCSSGEPLTPAWKPAARDMAALTLMYPSGSPQAVVAISSTDDCAFATSSMGGRVWLPEGFLAEIRALLAPAGR